MSPAPGDSAGALAQSLLPASPQGDLRPDFPQDGVVLSVFELPVNGITPFPFSPASLSQPVVGFVCGAACGRTQLFFIAVERSAL